MSQRSKFRREFVNRDALGNITKVSDDVAVHVLLVGCELRTSGSITTFGTTVQVPHPGRVDASHKVWVRSGTTQEFSTAAATVTRRERMASGVWELDLVADSGTIAFSAGDRLFLVPTSPRSAYANIYTSDTRATLHPGTQFIGGVASDPPTNALIADSDGVIEFYTPEIEVDLLFVDQAGTTVYGSQVEVSTGGERQFLNPQEFGAVANSASVDSWPAFNAALQYAQDDRSRRVVLHVPAGVYYLSGPLTFNKENIELWMDRGVTLTAHSSWSASGEAFLKLTGTRNSIRGGSIVVPASCYGVDLDGLSCKADDLQVLSGNIAIRVRGDKALVRASQFSAQADNGIVVDAANDCTILGNTFNSIGGAATSDVVISVLQDTFRATITQNVIDSCVAKSIEVVGDSAAITNTRGIVIASNQLWNNQGLGIGVYHCADVVVSNNTLRGIGGTPAAANRHGIYLSECINGILDGNVVDTVSGCGIKIDGPVVESKDMTVTGNVVKSCQQEAMDLGEIEESVISSNVLKDSALDAGTTYDVVLGAGVQSCVFTGNIIGGNGLDLDPAALVEIGHNLEL